MKSKVKDGIVIGLLSAIALVFLTVLRGLYNFPYNSKGTCGLVAICILLGYFDRFEDQMFLTNSSYLSGNGTSEQLQQDLYDNYMEVFGGIEKNDDNNPMASTQIMNTTKAFLEDTCSSVLLARVTHSRGNATNAVSTAKSHINFGYPTILVMISYQDTVASTRSGETQYFHDVVAFGYDSNNRFLAHKGWYNTAGNVHRNIIIISNALLEGCYTINYTGRYS